MGGVTDPRQSCVAMSVCGPIESEEPEEEAKPVVMEMEKEENVGVNVNRTIYFFLLGVGGEGSKGRIRPIRKLSKIVLLKENQTLLSICRDILTS